MIIGYHLSISKTTPFKDSIITAKHSGAKIIQLFSNNADDKTIEEVKNILSKNNIISVIHASYTINLALNWNDKSPHILTLERDFEFASKIGASSVIVHTGKQLTLSKQQGFNNMFSAIAYILSRTNPKINLLIETSAGQGTEMCYTLEELGRLFNKLKLLKNRRIGVCIDTCHLFAAGYDIRTDIGLKMYLECFEETIGLKRVKLIHLNDSKKPCGSRLDRHANIGKGEIGIKPLKKFVKFFAKMNIPIVLETPNGNYKYEMIIAMYNSN